MPHMMNCTHSGEGWCLECVEKVAEQVARLTAENEQLTAKLNCEPRLIELKYTPESGVETTMEHWAVKHLAASLLDTFREAGGENFVTMTLSSSDVGPIEVTIRPEWGGKKTPAMVIAELRAEVSRLTADRERMDWLETPTSTQVWSGTYVLSGRPLFIVSTMEDDDVRDEIGRGESLREAIDAARAGGQAK